MPFCVASDNPLAHCNSNVDKTVLSEGLFDAAPLWIGLDDVVLTLKGSSNLSWIWNIVLYKSS